MRWIACALFALALAPSVANAQFEVTMPGVRVAVAPPAPRVEVQPVRPSPAHVWIAGHWAWRGAAHVWLPGHWVLPPGAGYRWVPARWVQRGGQYDFFEGHWAYFAPPPEAVVAAPVATVVAAPVVVQQAPPAEIVEVVPVNAPWQNAFWIKGHWYWSGVAWQWASGHCEHPRIGHAWEHARWQRRPDGGWTFEPGHWRRQ